MGRGRIWSAATNSGEGLRSLNRPKPLTRRYVPTSPYGPYGRGEARVALAVTASSQPPADLLRKALVELGRVGLVRRLPHARIELVGVVADQDAPAIGLDAIEDDPGRRRRRGRRLIVKLLGTIERDLLDVPVRHRLRID